MRCWLGPWVWRSLAGRFSWGAPSGALGTLDLRSEPQRMAGPTPLGSGFFVTANPTNLGAEYQNLGIGDPRDLILGESQKRLVESRLSLVGLLAANRLSDVLAEVLMHKSDPEGLVRALPLDPTHAREYEIWVGGVRIYQAALDPADAGFAPTLDMLQRIYRRVRQEVLDGLLPPDHHRRMMGTWVMKYLIPYRTMQPSDLPDEPALAPASTFTDNFNRADSDTPGTGWAEEIGDFDILSNKMTCPAVGIEGSLRNTNAMSASDHYSQAIVSGPASGDDQIAGMNVRFHVSQNTFYTGWLYASDTKYYLSKMESGIRTEIGTAVTITMGLPEVYKTQVSGSTLKCFQAGVERRSETDTSITGNLRGGMYGYGTFGVQVSWDDFEESDVLVTRVPRPAIINFAPGRAFSY